MARARAPARSRFLFFDIDVDFDITWGDGARHDAAADRGACRCSTASSTSPRTGARCSRRRRTCSSSLRTLDPAADGARPAPARHAAGQPARGAARPRRSTRSATRSRRDANRFSLERQRGGGLAKRGDATRAVRAGAVPGLRRRGQALASRPSSPSHGGIDAVGRRRRSCAPARWRSARRPLRADHHRHELPPRSHALPAPRRRCCSRTSSPAPRVARSPLSQHQQAQAAAVRRHGRGRRPRRYAVALPADNTAVARTRSFPSEATARDYLARAARRRPALAGDAARHPRLRGGGMTDAARHLLVPALAAPGPRRARSPPPTATPASRRARRSTSQLELAGEPVGGGAPLTAPSTRDVALFGPGDIVGVDARAIVRTEPRDWITNFEPNYLAGDRVLRRGLPVALHAGGARRDRACGCGRGSRWSCSRRGEFAEGTNVAGPAAAVTSTSPTPRRFRRADELWAWAHVHVNRTLAASDAEFVSTDMGAVLPRLQATLEREPRPRLLAHRLPAAPRRRTRPTTPSSCRPSRAGGWPASGSTRPARRRHRARRGTPTPAAASRRACPYYHRWYFRTGAQRRLRVPGAAAQAAAGRPARRHARHGRAATPARTCRGIDDPALGGVLQARRRAAGAAPSSRRRAELAERDDATRTGTQPVPASVPGGARRLRQPRRRLRCARRRRRPTRPPGSAPRSRTTPTR